MRNQKNKTDQKDQSIKAILSLYRHNLKKLNTVFFLTFLANIFIAILPYFIGKIAGLVSQPQVSYNEVSKWVYLMVGCVIVHEVLWKLAEFSSVFWQTKVHYKFRDIIQKFSWSYQYEDFVEKPSGKIASAVHETYFKLGTLSYEFMDEDINNFIKFPVFIGILFITTKENAVLFMIFLAILIFVSWISLKKVRLTASTHSDMQSTVLGRLYDSMANFVNVKSFKSEEVELKSLHNDNKQMMGTSMKRSIADLFYWGYAGVVIHGGLWTCFAILNLWLYRNGRLDIAGFVTALTVLQQFTNSIWDISGRIKSITTNVSEYKQNYNYLFPGRNVVKEYYQDLSTPKQKIFKPAFNEGIRLNKLNFAYPDRKDTLVLKNISINIKKNEKIGIVGKSGSGKSTLIKLLLGFYEYKEGAVQIDGNNVSKEELSLINSYVPQDTTLFQQSVAYNIAYAKEGRASLKEVIVAAKKAHAHEFINSLPEKYDTLVGERGIKLSLGQRQRIAIARAFLKESDLLILDEATSALDSKTEKLVQESLEDLWEGKTVIAIAHRLSTLNNVDRIIVMDNGRIVEQGTKSELLSLGGIFADLWNHQKNGLIIDEDEKEL
ncbi:MAG: ATP-binding cassette, subfamily bacterial [Patescibacteria group bacterium]|nr:ATP-binding cassette, subfamily bacterial [Patescibacteria group bacterium]